MVCYSTFFLLFKYLHSNFLKGHEDEQERQAKILSEWKAAKSEWDATLDQQRQAVRENKRKKRRSKE